MTQKISPPEGPEEGQFLCPAPPPAPTPVDSRTGESPAVLRCGTLVMTGFATPSSKGGTRPVSVPAPAPS